MDLTEQDRTRRGLNRQILYGADLREPDPDRQAGRLADEVLRQRVFTHRAEDYYRAARDELGSGRSLVDGPDDVREASRRLLAAFVRALDERRPWPEPAFEQLDAVRWTHLRDAPVVARLALSQLEVRRKLSRLFDTAGADTAPAKVLVLRLRTGQEVALVAPMSVTERGVDLRSHGPVGDTLRDFAELTGIAVER